jgi:hypothetical protein
MKRLILMLSIILFVIFVTCMMKNRVEGLCGNYSLTYSKVKDLFQTADIYGISQAYNMHYKKDLLLDC